MSNKYPRPPGWTEVDEVHFSADSQSIQLLAGYPDNAVG